MSTDLEKRILKQKRGVVRFSTEHFSLQNKHLLPVKPPYNEKEVLCNKPKVCKATERDALRVRLDAALGASPRQLARRDGNRVGHPTPTYVEVKLKCISLGNLDKMRLWVPKSCGCLKQRTPQHCKLTQIQKPKMLKEVSQYKCYLLRI